MVDVLRWMARVALLGSICGSVPAALWAADPVVSNVRAQQLADRKVEVLYDLSGAPAGGATVSVAFSQDSGASYPIVPGGGMLSGHVGAGVANGSNRRIVWNAPADPGLPANFYATAMRAAVTAVDPGGAGVTGYAIVFARGAHPNATPWIANLNGSQAVELVAASLASYPKVANGTVVFMSEDYNGQGPGIYKMAADVGAAVEKIPNTENIRNAHGLNWDAIDIAPDGRRVIWAGPENGDYYQNHNVYVINIDGSGKTRIQRNTSKHFFNITWGEPDRVVFLNSSVNDAYTQRIHTMMPEGSGLTLAVAEFAAHGHIGGPAGRAVLTWTQPAPYLVTMNNSFSDMVVVPGPLYGYTFTSWHPTEDALFGCKGGNLYRIDRVTGVETLLLTGGSAPCYGGDVEGVSRSIKTIRYVAIGDS